VKKIKLTQGKFALVDDCDYDYLIQWNWHTHTSGRSSYARTDRYQPDRHRVFMHTIVIERMGLKGRVDHIDGNGLDDQRSNLRLSNGHNPKNRRLNVNNTSGYKGVHWKRTRQIWVAKIVSDGKEIYLGSFRDKKEAARMYNKAAKKYHGEFANLNEV
jgi:hypothetical protein